MTGPKELATVVRQFRLEAGLTQRQLEEKFQDNMFELFETTYQEYNGKKKYKPGTYVSKIETMTTKRPGWKRVIALADALGRDRDVFLALAGIRAKSDELLKKFREASDKTLFDNYKFVLTPDDDEEELSADEDTVDLGDDSTPPSVDSGEVDKTSVEGHEDGSAVDLVHGLSPDDGDAKPWVFVCHSTMLPPTLVHNLELFAKRRGLSIPAAVGQLMEIALSMFVI